VLKLTEQIPLSKIGKGFLVVGLVLLVMGFFFFYLASRVNWDYETMHDYAVNLSYPFRTYQDSQWGQSYEYYVRRIDMQANDYVAVWYPEYQYSQISGTLRIVLIGITPNGTETKLAVSSLPFYLSFYNGSFINYKNYPSDDFDFADVYLVTSNTQNVTISLTTELDHYETPQWALFGIGIVFSLSAMISIFKSKKSA
jgi:hypothetical protein